jgi:exocyst complex component 7
MNLTKKAENYEDQTLKWIFLLNNIYKLSKLFNDKQQQQQQNENNNLTINRIFLLAGKKDLKLFYQNEIRDYKKEYSACWSKLLSYIIDLNQRNPFNDSKLKDKERQLLKDRFSGFNKEFEDIYETQKSYCIPSEQTELAKELIVDNDYFISSHYKQFYETFARMNFAKNKEKYVKYTPEDLKYRFII